MTTRRSYIPLSRILSCFGILLAVYFYLTVLFEQRLKQEDVVHPVNLWIQEKSSPSSTPPSPTRQDTLKETGSIDDYTIESTDKSSNSKLQSFTQCMLQLEEYLYPRILKWFESSVPIPFSVKIYNGNYYVLLSLYGLDKKREMPMWRTNHTTYICNGISGGEDLGIHWRKGRFTLIVKCPNEIHPHVDNLETLAIIPKDKLESDKVTYSVKKLLECERKDIDLFSTSGTSSSRVAGTMKTGISVTFKGDRERALEWATYHHLLGFDHVWMYVNEPWKDGKDFPFNRDYVTWIPYNHNIQNYNTRYKKMPGHPMEQFRIASQNEALWRARRLGLDWMAFVDLDELVVLCNASKYETFHDTNGNGPIKTYLKDFAVYYGQLYLGIFLQSVPFGRNIEIDPTSTKELLMDYTWRENASLYTDWWEARNKLIVNIKEVTSVNIHYMGVGGELYKANVTELRVNHYKEKERGVFNRQRDWLHAMGDILEDTQLQRDYRVKVIQKLKRNK